MSSMATMHQLYREQFIDTDIVTAWDFISSPKNLDAITPDDMAFEIVSELPEKMFDGQLIEYRVGIPVLGRQTWVSELKHIRPGHSFVDEQRIGPYKFWYHYHEISMHACGVRFVDRIHYVLPFGPLGAIAQQLYVKSQLRDIFDYREMAMHEQLNRRAAGSR
jgi:ligand-binding SRPBCC domain-containing protein